MKKPSNLSVKIESELKQMPAKNIDKSLLGAVLTVTAKVSQIELRSMDKNVYSSNMIYMRLTWSNNSIFVYEKNPLLIKKMKNLKINDVVKITGIFEAKWFKGQKSSISVIAESLKYEKLGVLK